MGSGQVLSGALGHRRAGFCGHAVAGFGEDRQHTGNVSGLLVYAKTQEELLPDCMYNMGGSHIGAVTLDLSRDFSKIAAQLDAIAARFFESGRD